MFDSVRKACLAACLCAAAFSVSSAPVPYTDADQCSGCEMWITKYPGTKGQIELADGTILKFCSTRCMTCNLRRMEAEGKHDIAHVWVHDAGKVDWKKPDDAIQIEARNAWFVVGSSQKATMGSSLAPFADKNEALAFQAKFGGTLQTFDDLNRDFLKCRKPKKKAQ